MDGLGNVTKQDSGMWKWDYLIACFADSKICVSFGLWLLSCFSWLASVSLHFYLRCKRKSRYEESIFWNIFAFFGSMCNTIGALLSKQLTIQVLTGVFMALSDVIDFILTLFPICNSKHRVKTNHQISIFKRRRKPILSALSVCMMISLWSYSGHLYDYPLPEVARGPHRRLLGTALQDSTEVVGFTLGIIAVLVAWTGRVPNITKVCKGAALPAIQVWAVLFSALASAMYAAAVMSHDRHPEYLVRAIPWFLISMGAASLDIALLFLSCIMKRRRTDLVVRAALNTERSELLESTEGESEQETESLENTDQVSLNWTPLNMVPKRNISKKATMGQYVTLSIEHVQEDRIGAVRMPGDGQTHPGTAYNKEPVYWLDLPARSATRITHFSSSSSDRSSNTNDLEWDFEALEQSWNVDSCIAPSDSSVLHCVTDSVQQLASTRWPTQKMLQAKAKPNLQIGKERNGK